MPRINVTTNLGVDRRQQPMPGSWYELRDYWMPNDTRLEQRPGTVEFASKVVVGEVSEADSGNWTNPPDDYGIPEILNDLNPQVTKANKFQLTQPKIQLSPVLTTLPGLSKFQPLGSINGSGIVGSTIFEAAF